MQSSTKIPESPKRCPLCGIAMLASRSRPDSNRFDIFQCLQCETVIDLSGAVTRGSPRSND
jgi:5-methylcytosine-specific restriction endonuclease McrA